MTRPLTIFILLVGILAFLFHDAFSPELVQFSNDGPLGQMAADKSKAPDVFYGTWDDLNWMGLESPSPSMGPSGGIRTLCWIACDHIPRSFALALFFLVAIPTLVFVWHHDRGVCNWRCLDYAVGAACFTFAGEWALAMAIGVKNDYADLSGLFPLGCLFFIAAMLYCGLRGKI